ncbi:hypothetical protein [Rubellimicrobium arenae]|uniref:hypothetical protein n=1 Tax=Rubellimicrobium arenae TaxID=2817372 RepID=UPI001B3093FC|nr:hypothetical protein [Rubellimicrobium arenae]
MTLFLHNPANPAHLEDLRSRMTAQLTGPHGLSGRDQTRIERLIEVVRAMDEGAITSGQALEAFGQAAIPGFSFGRWLVDMVDEGVYLEAVYDDAA